MKTKNKFLFVIGFVVLIGTISVIIALSNNKNYEKRVEYYFNPSCPHCKDVKPLIEVLMSSHPQWKFYVYDVSQTSYKDIQGVPTIKIFPGDGREIILTGSKEIPQYFKCELEEKSTLECPTHLNLIRGSYFLE